MGRPVRGSSPLRTVSKLFLYAVGLIAIIYCSAAAYHFGVQIFSAEGVEEYPGTDLTIEVSEGTSMLELGELLEEYGIIKDGTVFYAQSFVYEVKSVLPGTYTFNTSYSGDRILSVVSAGPLELQDEATK